MDDEKNKLGQETKSVSSSLSDFRDAAFRIHKPDGRTLDVIRALHGSRQRDHGGQDVIIVRNSIPQEVGHIR